ncbi:MAG: diguanylate cyclase response regulator [Candidatus Solibacter sp.]|nr:diguanylate cyclase response regulator [Candidatus Solibacter sp.]
MRVLIADDSLVMRRLLQATLEGWGFDVVCAADGAEALACLQGEDPPRMAILDWMMPVMTGPDVCRMVRDLKSETYTYLILLTSKSQREDIVEGMGAGADDYVVKPFDKHELDVRLRAGRRILDLQMELMQAQEALRDQATKDPLTGCWNRRVILEVLERETVRAEREKRSLSLVMLDLDHFKTVNDTYGHGAGDEALRQVTQRVMGVIRGYDAIGRIGGEEFLIVLPGCDELCALSHAERLRRMVERTPVAVEGQEIWITVSVGATSLLPGQGFTSGLLVRSADAALYTSKRLGRNRVSFQLPEQIDRVQGASN